MAQIPDPRGDACHARVVQIELLEGGNLHNDARERLWRIMRVGVIVLDGKKEASKK